MSRTTGFRSLVLGIAAAVCLSAGCAAPAASSAPGTSEADKPKYGPNAHVLSHRHDFFRRAPAPDFWALIPYYLPQRNEESCSLASTTMLLNAARRDEPLRADDELVTQTSLLAAAHSELWRRATADGGDGVTLDELGGVVRDALRAYGFESARVQVVHADAVTPEALEALRLRLLTNERSADDFVLANFEQGVFTGDTGGGHVSPVGAYDADADMVLVLDPDRTWYEPYWVTTQVFLRGMATRDSSSGRNRGLVHVTLPHD